MMFSGHTPKSTDSIAAKQNQYVSCSFPQWNDPQIQRKGDDRKLDFFRPWSKARATVWCNAAGLWRRGVSGFDNLWGFRGDNFWILLVQWFLWIFSRFEFLLIGMIGIFWLGWSWEWDGARGWGWMGLFAEIPAKIQRVTVDLSTFPPRLLMLFSCTRLFGTPTSCGMIFGS